MKDTVVVAVAYSMRHPQYGKIIKKVTKLSVHNEIKDLAVGDVVEVAGSKPYSRTVFFKVMKVIANNAKQSHSDNPMKSPRPSGSRQKAKTK